MRIVIVAALALAALALVWWWLAPQPQPFGYEPDRSGARSEAPTAPRPEPLRSESAPPAERGPPQAASRAQDAPAAKPAPPTPEVAPANLELVVHDRATREPLASFTATLWTGATSRTRSSEDGKARFEAPLDQDFEIVVEAKGYVPSGRQRLHVTSAERQRAVTLELDKAMAQTGVVLTVVDAQQAPVTRVIAIAWGRGEDEQPSGPRLWERRSETADGVYALPDLQPGKYALDIVPCDANGDPIALVPGTVKIDLTGNESLPLRLELKPGALVRLEVRGADGQLQGHNVDAWLERGAARLNTTWQSRDGARVTRRVNGLPADAEAMLAGAVEPGAYRVCAARGRGQTVSKDVVLEAGAVAKIELTLP